MALDETAKEANYRVSIKKYLLDSLETAESKKVMFDKQLGDPDLSDKSIEEWVSVNIGPMVRAQLAQGFLNLTCCTREDPEGDALGELVDTVFGYLRKEDGGYQSIPFLIAGSPPTAMVPPQVLTLGSVTESSESTAPDGTKYKVLTCEIKWAAKI